MATPEQGHEEALVKAREAGLAKGKYNTMFLDGPHNRISEFFFGFKVLFEFLKGFRKLHFVGPCISIFGSARFKEGSEYYSLALEMGKRVANFGFSVMTGGGPGIMEAANKGAKEAGGKSVACNIELPFEQKPNPYLDVYVNIKYFFVRKVFLFKYSFGFIVLPGGFGTVDELFEALTLIQTKKMPDIPVVLMGRKYWEPLLEQVEFMEEMKTISEMDDEIFFITDDPDEAMEWLKNHIDMHAPRRKKFKPQWWLGEK